MTRFQGFGPDVRDWFLGLEADNSRDYFAARRGFFEERVRDQTQALLDEMCERLGGEVKLFRQNRDVRFSPDKSPYKTNTYGVIYGTEQGALYASVSARGLVAGSGYHVLARDQLDRYREAVADADSGPALAKLAAAAVEKAGLDLWGESLATAPRGYPKDHERIELLRRKSLALGALRGFGEGLLRGDTLRFVTKTWRAAAPVTGWLEEHVGASTLPVERRPR